MRMGKVRKSGEVDRLATLIELTQTMVSNLNLDELLTQIMDMALKTLEGDTGSLMLLDEDRKELRIKAAVGLGKKILENTTVKLGEGIAGYVAKEGKAQLLIGDLRDNPRFRKYAKKKHLKSALCVPLKIRNKIIGVLSVNNVVSSAIYTPQDLDFLTAFANSAAIAIENARLYTELKLTHERLVEAEQELVQSEKMAAIGQLASGVAHEINNPLFLIRGSSEFLLSKAGQEKLSPRATKYLKRIVEKSAEIHSIVEKLLSFSWVRAQEYSPVNINQEIDNVLSLVEGPLAQSNIRLKKSLDAQVPLVKADRNQLQQVFLGLITNAQDAMPKGGELHISTRVLKSGNKPDRIEITFQDTGIGIPPGELPRIFDPFYTTKEAGKATGLGLSVSRNIIQKHGGRIRAESKVGKGTAFIVELPVGKHSMKPKMSDRV